MFEQGWAHDEWTLEAAGIRIQASPESRLVEVTVDALAAYLLVGDPLPEADAQPANGATLIPLEF